MGQTSHWAGKQKMPAGSSPTGHSQCVIAVSGTRPAIAPRIAAAGKGFILAGTNCPLLDRALLRKRRRTDVATRHHLAAPEECCEARLLKWSEREDLNLRPLVSQTSALTGLRHAPMPFH